MLYTQAKITTAGVVTHEDKENRGLYLEIWGNIIVLNDGAEWWLTRNSFTAITKAEAQTIYDAWIDAAIAGYVEDNYHHSGVKEIAERGTLP
jgi:hypothetical protein|tara:strand:- start:708 stop:983 length:276 start_codon:yes stop_codon:yes gene_type:complete